MHVHEMLTVLDDAIAHTQSKRRRTIALEMHAPGGVVLGERGRPMPDQPGERPTYGFTRGQCERMRATLLAAAREDAHATGVDVDVDTYTGEAHG